MLSNFFDGKRVWGPDLQNSFVLRNNNNRSTKQLDYELEISIAW